jgi:hypothetical protein
MADPTTRAENNDDFSPIANPVETLYLAYCDILGFSNRILNDFDKTLETYRSFGDLLGGANFKNVRRNPNHHSVPKRYFDRRAIGLVFCSFK